DASLNGKLFPTRAAALAALGERPSLPSMETVNGMLKPFNDGLYAAAELSAEDGSDGGLINKQQLLVDLLQELTTRAASGAAAEQAPAAQASADLAAALLSSGQTPAVPTEILASAQKEAADFEADPLHAAPSGFYTWTPELSALFRRDRFLQTPHRFGSGGTPTFDALAETALVLGQNSDLAARYGNVLSLYAQLTDPFYDASPMDLVSFVPDSSVLTRAESTEHAFFRAHPGSYPIPSCNTALAYWPASEGVDTRILRPIVCSDTPPPDGADLLALLVAQVESGAVNLAPRPDSGWYDQQIYALETLLAPDLAPEKDNLLLTRAYKEKLVETFKSILIQTRETHIKQLGSVTRDSVALIPPRPFDVRPPLQVEPFPTFYLRTARAYRFVEGVLGATLGGAFLAGTGRLLEDGTRSTTTLQDELRDKQLLLYGLHVLAADSIGSAYGLSSDELATFPPDAARTRATAWLTAWQDDVDVNRDPRVSVPVTTADDSAVYFAVAGVKVLRIHASYPDSRRPEIVSAEGCVVHDWLPYQPYLLVEDSLQLRRPAARAPLTRDAFRALCDAATTEDELRAAFESAP
ncbi:MAG TPA: hypothetical protein VNG33_03955, partial [Polyangiaceae bacterium]|nr:hypothetical protein [Polyangiaceae bacterium]